MRERKGKLRGLFAGVYICLDMDWRVKVDTREQYN